MMNTKFIEFAEGRIAYDDAAIVPAAIVPAGGGPLVVCAPGMGDLRGSYRYLAPQLAAAGYRVVTMDLRGHGESSVGWKDYSASGICHDMIALIRHLNAGPAVIVGNSFAAGAAVWAAASAPELVRALVLLGPAVHGKVPGSMRLLIEVLFARPWGPAAWQWYYKNLFKTRKPADLDDFSNAVKQNLSQAGRMEGLKQMMLTPTPDSETRLDQAHVPALVIMGSKDPDFKDPAGEAKWIAEQLNGACTMIEGAGHYPQTEMPEISGPIIVKFLNELDAQAGHGTANGS